jgi:hypothetical protein
MPAHVAGIHVCGHPRLKNGKDVDVWNKSGHDYIRLYDSINLDPHRPRAASSIAATMPA